MHVTRFSSAQAFLDRTRAQLERNEAANNLMIGVAAHLCEDSTAYGDLPPYLAIVEQETGDQDAVAIALMTAPYSLIVHSESDQQEQAFRLLAADLMEGNIDVAGVNAPVALAHAFADIWISLNDCTAQVAMQTRTFQLREVEHPQYSPGHFRAARADELTLVVDWVRAFTLEALGDREGFDVDRVRRRFAHAIDIGALFFWDDDGPVSMAGTGRHTTHGVNIGLVYSPPDLRGRGYASSCVAQLSQALLDDGWDFCTLFTDLANPTSNGIYQKIGFQPICDYVHIRFE